MQEVIAAMEQSGKPVSYSKAATLVSVRVSSYCPDQDRKLLGIH